MITLVDPVAAGTLALAMVTAILAAATVWLGWNTRSMSRATQDMASATRELVAIESARRGEEGRAELTIERREPVYLGTLPLRMITRWEILIVNTLPGEATAIAVRYSRGSVSGIFHRDRLGGLGRFTLSSSDFDQDPGLPAVPDPVSVQLEWVDSRGQASSPIYRWPVDGWGPPLVSDRQAALQTGT